TEGKTFEVLGIYKAFKTDIANFNEEIKAAAKEHNKELVKELLKWNSKYDALVNELEATAVQFIGSIGELKKKLAKLH
ncbi:30232_t:CDS:1, partial [Racocetra persica]